MGKRGKWIRFCLAACMAAGVLTHGMSQGVHAEESTLKPVDLNAGITYERNEQGYVQFINLNGNSVIIKDVIPEDGKDVQYHNIYIDKNRNGIVDGDEAKVELDVIMDGVPGTDVPAGISVYGIYQASSTTPIRITLEGSGYGQVVAVQGGELAVAGETAIVMDVNVNSIGSVVGASKGKVSASGAAEKVMDFIVRPVGSIQSLKCAEGSTITAGEGIDTGVAFTLTNGSIGGCNLLEGTDLTMSDSTKTALDIRFQENGVVSGGINGVSGGSVVGAVKLNAEYTKEPENGSGSTIGNGDFIRGATVDGDVTVTGDYITASSFNVAIGTTITGNAKVLFGENSSILSFKVLDASTAEKNVVVDVYGAASSSYVRAYLLKGMAASKNYSVGGDLTVISHGGTWNTFNVTESSVVIKGNAAISILDGSIQSMNGISSSSVGGDYTFTTGETVQLKNQVYICSGSSSVGGDCEFTIYNSDTSGSCYLYPLSGNIEVGGNVTATVKGGKYYYINNTSVGNAVNVDGNYTAVIEDVQSNNTIYGIDSVNVGGNANVTIKNAQGANIYGYCANSSNSIGGTTQIDIIGSKTGGFIYGVSGGHYVKDIEIHTTGNECSQFYAFSSGNAEANVTIQCSGENASSMFYGLYNGTIYGKVVMSLEDCECNTFYGNYNAGVGGDVEIKINGGTYKAKTFTLYNGNGAGNISAVVDGATLGTSGSTLTISNTVNGKQIMTCDIKDTCTIQGTCQVSSYTSSGGILVRMGGDNYYAGQYPIAEDVTAKDIYFANGSVMGIPEGITMEASGMIYAKDGTSLLIEGTLKGAICQDTNYKYTSYFINGGKLDTTTEHIYLLYYPITVEYLEKGGTVQFTGTMRCQLKQELLFGCAGSTESAIQPGTIEYNNIVSAVCTPKKGYTLTSATVKKASEEFASDMAKDEKTENKYSFDMGREPAEVVITFTGQQIVLGKTVSDPVAKLNEEITSEEPLYNMANVAISNDGQEGTVSYELDKDNGLPEGLQFEDGKIFGTPTVAYEKGKKTVIHVTGKNDTVADLTLNIIVTAGDAEQGDQDGRILVDKENKEINLLGSSVVIEAVGEETGIFLDDNRDGIADKQAPVYQGDLSEYAIYGLKDADWNKPISVVMKGGKVASLCVLKDSEVVVENQDAATLRVLGGIVSGSAVTAEGSKVTGTIALIVEEEAETGTTLVSKDTTFTGSLYNNKGTVTISGTYQLRESITVKEISVGSSGNFTLGENVILTADKVSATGSFFALLDTARIKAGNVTVGGEAELNGSITCTGEFRVSISAKVRLTGQISCETLAIYSYAVVYNKGSLSCNGTADISGKLVLQGGTVEPKDNEWEKVCYPITFETNLDGATASLGSAANSYYYEKIKEGDITSYYVAGGKSMPVQYTKVQGYSYYYSVNGSELSEIEGDNFDFEMPRKNTTLQVIYVPTDIEVTKQFADPVGVVGTTYTEEKPLYDLSTLSIANDTTKDYGTAVRYQIKGSAALPKGLTLSDGKLVGTPKEANEAGVKVTITVTGRNGTTADIILTIKILEESSSMGDINAMVTRSGSTLDLHGNSVVIRAAVGDSSKTSIYLDENQDGIADNSLNAYEIDGTTELDLSGYTIYGYQYTEDESCNRDITIHMYGGSLGTLCGAYGKDASHPVTVNGNVSVYVEGGKIGTSITAGSYVTAQTLKLDITGGQFNGRVTGAMQPLNVENVDFGFKGKAVMKCTTNKTRGDIYVVENGNVTGDVLAEIGVESDDYGISGSYSYYYGVYGAKIGGNVNYTIDGMWKPVTQNTFVEKSDITGDLNINWKSGELPYSTATNVPDAMTFIRNGSVDEVKVSAPEGASIRGRMRIAANMTVRNVVFEALKTTGSLSIDLYDSSSKTQISGYGYVNNNGKVEIAGAYTIDSDIEVNGLTVDENAIVTIAEGTMVTNKGNNGCIKGTVHNLGTWNSTILTTVEGVVDNEGNIEFARSDNSSGLVLETAAMLINRNNGNVDLACRIDNKGKIVNYGELTQSYKNGTYKYNVGTIYTTTLPFNGLYLSTYVTYGSTINYSVSLDYPEFCVDTVTVTDGSGNALASSGIEGDTNQYLKGGSAFKVQVGKVISDISLSSITYGSKDTAAVSSDMTTWTGTLGYEPTVITLNFDGKEPITIDPTEATVTGAKVGVRTTAGAPLYDLTQIKIEGDTEIAGGYVSYTVDKTTPLPEGLSLVNGKIYGTPTKASSKPQKVTIIVKGMNQTSANFILTFESVEKGMPTLIIPSKLSADAGAALSTVEFKQYSTSAASAGTYKWKDETETVGDVGGITKKFEAVFTPENAEDYDWTQVTGGTYNEDGTITLEVDVTINKLVPEYELPESFTATYGQTLADVALPSDDNGSFSWEDADTTPVGEVGEQSFRVTYTPVNTDKYKSVENIEVTVKVQPAEVTFTPLEEIHAVYGDTLADVELPEAEGGKYQWITQSTTVPEDGKTYRLGFKPTDIVNYNWTAIPGYSAAYKSVIFDVVVIVEPRAFTLSGLPIELTVEYGKQLSEYDLPYLAEGIWYLGEDEIENPLVSADGLPNGAFEWADGSVVVDSLEEMETSVNFRPEEEKHYKLVEDIKVIVKVSHTHAYGNEWEKDEENHWKECECKEVSEKAVHEWDAGEITKEPTETKAGERTLTCEICGAKKVVKEPALGEEHEHVYGDKWKSDKENHWKECECGEISEKAAHKWDEGKVTKAPTETEAGERTLTCEICGTTKIVVEPANSGGTSGGNTPGGNTPGGNTSDGKDILPAGTVRDDAKTKAKYKVADSNPDKPTVVYVESTNKNVSTVTIPAVVTLDGVEYTVTSIDKNAFKNNKKIKRVVISKNITSIGDNAFSGCSKLTTVTIGANVTTIGKSAFANCAALKKIVIPGKVNKIGSKAFYGCKKLLNITIKTTKLTTKNVGNKAFAKAGSSNYKKITVKVPKKQLKAYKAMLKKKGLSPKAKIK